MTVGDRIRFQREALCISLTELATKVNISKQTLYKYETNIITNIPSNKIEDIAKVLNTSPAYLMGWEDCTPHSNLTNNEKKLINAYRKASEIERACVHHILNIKKADLE